MLQGIWLVFIRTTKKVCEFKDYFMLENACSYLPFEDKYNVILIFFINYK